MSKKEVQHLLVGQQHVPALFQRRKDADDLLPPRLEHELDEVDLQLGAVHAVAQILHEGHHRETERLLLLGLRVELLRDALLPHLR